MLEQRTIVDKVEISRDGSVQVRLVKQVVDGERVLASDYHRTAFEPGADLDAAIALIDADLVAMGAAPVAGAAEWDRIRRRVLDLHDAAARASRRATIVARPPPDA